MLFKLTFSFILVLLISCTEIERDNILDPKNPSSRSESVILLEAFVNTTHPTPTNGYAVDAIKILKANHPERLIIVELHRDVSTATDNLTFPESDFLHSRYTTAYALEPGRNKGVPDLYFNGAINRVQGSFDVMNVVTRSQSIVESLLLSQGEYTIEGDAEYNGSEVAGKYRIARLGDKRTEEMILRIYITYNSEQVNSTAGTGHNTVSAVESVVISEIEGGEFVEESFSINVDNDQAEKIVFVLMDSFDLSVLHAFEKEIL